ncbi:mitochondrial carrier protein [Oryctes borbonicus]|uniref:Mitochondrial carrier protein n=1 Tax=Oryctes borbonicus TaxID=1629725 RepID=A0A0T6AVP7_9SCAR|nr:mitochondrial carrier protein [Oryctes borbonicus]
MDFIIGGMAAVCAGFFTNPLEVIKIRMQLQGELQKKNKQVIHYRNILHTSYQIIKHEGIFALQKGIVPALWVQLIMNGSRLGFYDYGLTHGFCNDYNGNPVFLKSIVISGFGGVMGHYLSNPFYLIKTHLQSESAKAIAVGYQHHYEGTWKALTNVYSKGGFRGLFRGGVAVIPRAFVASSSQLMSFVYCKEWLHQKNYFKEHPVITCFISSMIGGIAISVMTAPFDLILVRLYNQDTLTRE